MLAPQGWTFHAASGNQLTHVPGLPLGTRGGILANVDLPADGEYHINIADMATHIWGNGMEYENPLVVTVDNKIVYQTVIGGEEDMKLYDQVQSGALDRVNARLKNIKFEATAGPHKIGVTFRRQSFAESDDQLQIFAPGGGQDRSYRVSSFQLLGPFDVTGLSSTPSRDRIFICNPAKDKTKTPEACAKADFLDAGEARLSPSGNQRRHRGAHAVLRRWRRSRAVSKSGIREGITGMLASPFFLYRGERVPAGLKPGEKYAITDLELASKLSFFLWNSIPDDELLDLAIKNKLSDPATLDQAGPAHAGRSAIEDAGEQFRVPVARYERARRGRSGHATSSRMPPAAWTRVRISAPSSRCLPTASSGKTAASWICCAPAIRT